MIIVGFDPGKDKCGIAVITENRELLEHQVVAADEAITRLKVLNNKYKPGILVMGDQTTAKTWKRQLESCLDVPIVLVDERNSTLEARERYWLMYPPKGLKRLIPQGMRLPPRPIDDIVAILLIERHLGRST